MLHRTSPFLGLFSRGKSTDMSYLLEAHFWGLTRYRILPRFLGLDYAGNVICYPSYRKQSFGGWSAVTLASPAAGNVSDLSGVNVLEDGYPMHYKATKKLNQFVQDERQRWQAQIAKEDAKKKEAAAAQDQEGGASEGAEKKRDSTPDSYDREAQFRDRLAIKFSNPRFYTRHLCLSYTATFLYKCVYFYLWAVLVSLIVQGYLMFRAWVNPPARAGLKNLEEHVLHVPRLLFAGCVYGVAWLFRTARPVLDPLVQLLDQWFPQVNWDIFSSENLASKAQHLADDTHPSAEKRKEEIQKVAIKNEQERRTWWTRVLMVLLAIFSVLCVL